MARTRGFPPSSSTVGNPTPKNWIVFGKEIFLWHGTLKRHADNIRQNGVNPKLGRPDLDFGLGFYTTTWKWQGGQWADDIYREEYPAGNPKDPPAVVWFQVPLDRLATLENISFIRGDPDNELFWSFVIHCRGSTVGKIRSHRPPPKEWYDIVSGPVVAAWIGGHRRVIRGFDQFSFHTDAAAKVLNDLIASKDPRVFGVEIRPLPY